MNDSDKMEDLRKQVETLQEQMRNQEKLASLGLLSAGISHEVQNPLNFVINFSKMSAKLLDDLMDIIDENISKFNQDDKDDVEDICADLKENMSKILSHGERAISIIRGILLQSRGKSGEFMPSDVGGLVHEYVWLAYHSMRANDKSFNIAIHEEYQDNMPKFMLIPQDISRAVLNVMNNACYTLKERAGLGDASYSPAVTVKVRFDGNEELTISISDNGMGMTPEIKAKIFENFFTTKPAGQGTGLGMGIIRSLIEDNHNGTMLCDTEPGIGTTITFKIPVKICR